MNHKQQPTQKQIQKRKEELDYLADAIIKFVGKTELDKQLHAYDDLRQQHLDLNYKEILDTIKTLYEDDQLEMLETINDVAQNVDDWKKFEATLKRIAERTYL